MMTGKIRIKKWIRRSCLWLLFALLIFSVHSKAGEVQPDAPEILTWGDFSYQKNGVEATICGYTGADADLKLPEQIDGLPVTAVGEKAFYENETIASVAIGPHIKSVGNSAFSRCTNLVRVKFENADTHLAVQPNAFFYSSNLRDIEFGRRSMTVGTAAFAWTGISELSLPSTVQIAPGASKVFYGNEALKTAAVALEEIPERMFEDCARLQKVTFETPVERIGKNAFDSCESLVEIVLPEGLLAIGDHAFTGCRTLPELALPESLLQIGEYAFGNCETLEELTIPAQVVTLYRTSFNGCKNISALQVADKNQTYSSENNVIYDKEKTRAIVAARRTKGSLALPDTLKSIEPRAFSQCSLIEQVALPDGLQTIGEYAFSECAALQKIVIPDSVQGVLDNTFRECSSLVYAKVGNGVTGLAYTFVGCESLEEVLLAESVQNLGSASFSGCASLKKVNIPEGVTELGWFLFHGCESLEELEMPKSLKVVGFRSLEYCSSLESLTFYEDLEEVDRIWYAIAHNENLQYVFFRGPYVELSDNVFEGMNATFTVFYRENYPEWTAYEMYPTVAVTDAMLSVKENIQALDISRIKLDDKERLQSYQALYESLEDREKLFYLPKDLDLLEKCMGKVEALEVGALIDALPKPEEIQPEDKTEIRAAQKAYKALGSEKQQYVTSAQVVRLDKARTALEELLRVKKILPEKPAKKENGEYVLTIFVGEKATVPITVTPDYAEDQKLDAEAEGQDQIVSAQIDEEKNALLLTGVAPGTTPVYIRHRDLLEITLRVKVVLAAPTGLQAKQEGNSTATITWNRSENASQYAIYRQDGEQKERLIAYTTGNIGIFVDTDLKPGVVYTYRVAACLDIERENYDSSKSEPAQLSLAGSPSGGEQEENPGGSTGDQGNPGGSAGDQGNPSGQKSPDAYKTEKLGSDLQAPAGLKAAHRGKRGVKLTWTKREGASGYEIYRSKKKNGNYKKIKTIKGSSVKKYIDKKRSPGTYFYKIRCYRGSGAKKVYSHYSKRVKIKISSP